MGDRELAEFIAKLLNDKKAQDIEVLDVHSLSDIMDCFVICTGTSNLQNKALCDFVVEKTGEIGLAPHRIEGRQSAGWILIDFGHVIIHIFKKEMRDFYGLDRLWSDAEKIKINF